MPSQSVYHTATLDTLPCLGCVPNTILASIVVDSVSIYAVITARITFSWCCHISRFTGLFLCAAIRCQTSQLNASRCLKTAVIANSSNACWLPVGYIFYFHTVLFVSLYSTFTFLFSNFPPSLERAFHRLLRVTPMLCSPRREYILVTVGKIIFLPVALIVTKIYLLIMPFHFLRPLSIP